MTDWAAWGNAPSGLPGSSTSVGGPGLFGTVFTATSACQLAGYRWYVVDGGQPATGVPFGSWHASGAGSGSFLAGSEVTSGALTVGTSPNDVMLDTPVTLTPGDTYVAVVGASATPASPTYFTGGGPGSAGLTAGPLNVFSDDSGDTDPDPMGNAQGVYVLGSSDPTSHFPDQPDHGWNFWLSPILRTSDLTVTESGSSGGVDTYSVTSPENGGSAVDMRVLPPTHANALYRPRILMLLPVEPAQGVTFGDSIAIAQGLGIHDEYNLTCVAPGYAADPWYADHPTDATIRQETFTLLVRAWVLANLGPTFAEVLLAGFSKSGLGGSALLFRNQALFGGGAWWDAPFMATALNEDGTLDDPTFGAEVSGNPGTVYGTDACFQAYRLDTGIAGWKAPFTAKPRIHLGGHATFQADVTAYDGLLTTNGVAHQLGTMASTTHAWHPQWLGEGVGWLMSTRRSPSGLFIGAVSGLV